jgi:hypothetical protein
MLFNIRGRTQIVWKCGVRGIVWALQRGSNWKLEETA